MPLSHDMRLRFSLRLILVGITLAALALYWLFVRPTQLANRFVAAIKARDYETARSLLHEDFWAFPPQTPLRVDFIYAEVRPREWNDIWHLQRRLILRVACHTDESNGQHIEWTDDTDVVARILGLEIILPTGDNPFL